MDNSHRTSLTCVVLCLALAAAIPVVAGEQKIVMCHCPPGNLENCQSITVSEAGSSAHRLHHHADYLGRCNATAFGTITPDGGVVTLDGVASVTFPAGVLASDQLVQVTSTSEPATAATFVETAAAFAPGPRANQEIRINTGSAEPGAGVEIQIQVTESLRQMIPPTFDLRVFVQNLWIAPGEKIDSFTTLGDSFPWGSEEVSASLPAWVFSNGRRSDGTFEAILLIGSTPKVMDTARAPESASACGVAVLSQPLPGPLIVRDPLGHFGDPRPLSNSGTHLGTDFVALEGTPVQAMAEGCVETVACEGGDPGCEQGWGQFVRLRHTDIAAGQSTYAHLALGSVTVPPARPGHPEDCAEGGQSRVSRGQRIASSDCTGNANNLCETAPHLHVEYVARGMHLDPATCITVLPAFDLGELTPGPNSFLPGGGSVVPSVNVTYTAIPGAPVVSLEVQFAVEGQSLGSTPIFLEPGQTMRTFAPRAYAVPNIPGLMISFSAAIPGTTEVVTSNVTVSDPLTSYFLGTAKASGTSRYDGATFGLSMYFARNSQYGGEYGGGIYIEGNGVIAAYEIVSRARYGNSVEFEFFTFNTPPVGVTNGHATVAGDQLTGQLDFLGGKLNLEAVRCLHPVLLECRD